MYQQLSRLGKKYFSQSTHNLFKFFFNLSPMYSRSTGKVMSVAKGFWKIEVKIPISYKNRNYAGTIFGGSLFAATDPIYMVQLIQIIGSDYIVWDKSSVVKFRRPATTDVFVEFCFTPEEIEKIKADVADQNEIDLIKKLEIKSKEGKVVCEIEKTIYVANKEYYKKKRKAKSSKNGTNDSRTII